MGLNLQEQTLNEMGAKGTNFDLGGSGPSDVIAYPNLYQVCIISSFASLHFSLIPIAIIFTDIFALRCEQLFGSGAQNMVLHIKNSISSWAKSQANSAVSASALETIYGIQANLIINDNGAYPFFTSHRLDLNGN